MHEQNAFVVVTYLWRGLFFFFITVVICIPVIFPSSCLAAVFQKRRMRRKGGWGQAGGPIHILRACQEITAGKGQTRPPRDSSEAQQEFMVMMVIIDFVYSGFE